MSNWNISAGNEHNKICVEPFFKGLKKRMIIIMPALLFSTVAHSIDVNNTDVLLTTSAKITEESQKYINLKRHAQALAFAESMTKAVQEAEMSKTKNGGSATQWLFSISVLIITSIGFYVLRSPKIGKKHL